MYERIEITRSWLIDLTNKIYYIRYMISTSNIPEREKNALLNTIADMLTSVENLKLVNSSTFTGVVS